MIYFWLLLAYLIIGFAYTFKHNPEDGVLADNPGCFFFSMGLWPILYIEQMWFKYRKD